MRHIDYDPRAAAHAAALARTEHWRKLAAGDNDSRSWPDRIGDALNALPFAAWVAAAVLCVALSYRW